MSHAPGEAVRKLEFAIRNFPGGQSVRGMNGGWWREALADGYGMWSPVAVCHHPNQAPVDALRDANVDPELRDDAADKLLWPG